MPFSLHTNKTMTSSLHILLFPFMAKGHTIPLLDLARPLLHHNAAVTIFTTPSNRPFISANLSDVPVTIIDLPFPQNVPGIPPTVESTDKLPSMSLFPTFAIATKLIQPHFEAAIQSLPPVTFMITDGFLGWTLDSANKFKIPRFAYYGMSIFAGAVSQAVMASGLLLKAESDDEVFEVPAFPWLKLTRNDFERPFTDREPGGLLFNFVMEQIATTAKSHGLIVNSFYELEPVYVNYYSRECKPKAWPIGPFCLAQAEPNSTQKPPWILWLDEKLELGTPVLYIAFGSQAEVSPEQFEEIKTGLEKSDSSFLWVVREKKNGFNDGFEERIKGRGLVVRQWVNQREILGHDAVKGFLSHCGWNSVLESICAAVPILAWPLMAEQHLNARMVVEELKIGIRVETVDGGVRGFVKSEGLEKTVRELMEGETGKELRKKVKGTGVAAIKAVEEGGSSWCALNQLIREFEAVGRNSCCNFGTILPPP